MTPIAVPCPHCGAVLKVRDPNRIGHRAKCPKCAQVFRLDVPAEVGAAAEERREARGKRQEKADERGGSNEPSFLSPLDSPPLPFITDSAPVSVAAQMQAQHKQKRRRLLISSGISAAILLGAGLVAGYVYQTMPKEPPVDVAEGGADSTAEEISDGEPASADAGEAQAKPEPIKLKYIPAGTRIVVHLRPSEFWKPDSHGEEFRFCLGPIGEFLAVKIKDLAKREPAEIDEALFCLIPNERGTPPDIAAVFSLKAEAKKSQLLDEFGGRRAESADGTPYYITGERAYFLPDLKTIAACPVKLAEEMVTAGAHTQPTSPGIDELLSLTDRLRPITVVFEPVSTRIDAEFLMPSNAIPLLEQFCDWLGPEVETVVWSMAWQQDLFRSEAIVRNQGGLDTRILDRDLKTRLGKVADTVLGVVRQMNPSQAGRRQLIGRFPAMTKAFTLATRTQPGPRHVKLVTTLPERAAPNLALGTLLTWDESTRTTLKSPSSGSDPGKNQADNVPLAEKLQRKISVEFKKTPLQVAFETIAEEIKAKVAIDGDGLRLAAYTKNMEQNFSLENTPAIGVIEKILKQPMYDKMCLVIDTKYDQLLITTYAAAEQRGETPYQFPK